MTTFYITNNPTQCDSFSMVCVPDGGGKPPLSYAEWECEHDPEVAAMVLLSRLVLDHGIMAHVMITYGNALSAN